MTTVALKSYQQAALDALAVFARAAQLKGPYEIEKRQVGELWARKSVGRCLFSHIIKDKRGVGVQGQLDALLT